MGRFAFVIGTVLALAVLANPVDAQLNYGVQGAWITSLDEATDLNGEFGLGGRIGFDLPALPIGVYGSGTFFFPDCVECKYNTWTLGAKVGIPLAVVFPYLHSGWQWRSTSVADVGNTENGGFVGLGVSSFKFFVEGSWEFNPDDPAIPDFDNDPIVIKVGYLFGG